MRIGLLEDDASQIELIRLWTRETGDELEAFMDGASFRKGLQQQAFDLLVLDWHLPDTTGIDELDWLRQQRESAVPVIFITSRDSEESVVEALDHGADDYMVKPVRKEVTLARIKALQRRSQQRPAGSEATQEQPASAETTGITQYEPYAINHDTRSIAVEDEVIKLTNKEYQLAAYLFANAGCLVTRDQLMQEIWGTTAELNTRTVDTHISRIRSKLGIKPSIGWQLSSIYQRGYRLFRSE